MKKFFAEFKKFITRGNIVDMSVGVIVGGAFTAIVNGLSNNILKPIINWFLAMLLGSDSLSGIFTYLKKVEVAELDANGVATGNMVVDLTQSIYIDWGAFINAIINFLIIAFVLFTIVKVINRISDAQKKSNDIKVRIAFKQEKGLKLSKKEKAFLAAEEEAARKAEEERIAQEEAAKNAPKVVTTEELLTEIRDLLKNK
ncbi:MAG: large conductance mechanosensitive channel protein MscL [Bacilli bacterium]|nr:large conductance mechanosensitive channel protein MscL [Bacilli bacterium]